MTLQAQIIAKKDFPKITFKLFDNGIMNVVLKTTAELMTLEDLAETMEWVASLGENKYLNLYEGDFSCVDAKVRERIASPEANQFTIADAYVVKNISDKMVGNFYMRVNKPVKPTREFNDRDQAIEWLLTQKEALNPH